MDVTPGFAQLSAEIDVIAARISAARAGRLTDFNGLQSEVAALCRRLEAVPREQARRHLPALRALLRELDLLAGALENPGQAR